MNLHTGIQKWYAKRKARLAKEGSYIFNTKGYTLILVLIVTTLLISLTSNFIIETQTSISYMREFDGRLKAESIAHSGIELARYLLDADKNGVGSLLLTGKSTDKNIDSYEDIWALDFPSIPLEGGSVKFVISDENAKININAFANQFTEQTKYYYMAQVFFINMGLIMDYADIIHDWIDIDDSKMPYGAESGDYYMSLMPPYSAKNRAMDSIDELLMLKNISPEIFYGLGGGNHGIEENLVNDNMGNHFLDPPKIDELLGGKAAKQNTTARNVDEIKIGKEKSRDLSDYFRVYGDNKDFTSDYNKININTASYRVISALTENMTDDKVSELIRRRLIKPYSSVDEIKDIIDNDAEFETLKKYITVKSYIFRIKAMALNGSTKVTITAYYNRDKKKILYWCEE